MRSLPHWIILLLLTGLVSACSSPAPQPPKGYQSDIHFPKTQRQDTADTYHGTRVATPYQWLEASHQPAVKQWRQQQQAFTQTQVAQIPAQSFIKQRLTELFNVEWTSTPVVTGEKLAYLRNNGLQSQAVLYIQNDIHSPPLAVVDPNTIDPEGHTAVVNFSMSPDGRYLAYGLSESGSDWVTWRITDLQSGAVFDDTITGTKFSPISWYPDSGGFYYSRYPSTTEGFDEQQPVQVFYHQIGHSSEQDIAVTQPRQFGRLNPYPEVTSDGKYLLLNIHSGPMQTKVYRRPLKQTRQPFKSVLIGDGEFHYLASKGSDIYFLNVASKGFGRVVKIDTADNNQQSTVLPSNGQPIKDAVIISDKIIVHYLDDVQSRLRVFSITGNSLDEFALPRLSSVSGLTTDNRGSTLFFKVSSFTQPGRIYRYQALTNHTELWRESPLPVDRSRYQVKQVFVPSGDGTVDIPMFVIHAKDLKPNANTPTLLSSYGGFGRAELPSYHPEFMAWLEFGGVLAVANIRGGGEYGETWHQAGAKANKHQAIADYLAAADWLVSNHYTSRKHLTGYGKGHGAMILTAAMTQQPQQFAAAIADVGVYDLLRYQAANGNARAWQSEFGISSNADDFAHLYQDSPLHSVTPGRCYPATILTTGSDNQRVAPWHSYKMTAALQYAQSCNQPIVLDLIEHAGHGDFDPVWIRVRRAQRQLTFALNQVNPDWLKSLNVK